MRSSKKHTLDLDSADRQMKIQRTNSTSIFGSQQIPSPFSDSFGLPSDQHSFAGNALASYLNRAQSTTNKSVGFEKGLAESKSMESADPKTPSRPFTYRPLEFYRQAEALRALFTREGLDYMSPRPDLALLSPETLAPYIAQWEDCLTHWCAITGPDAYGTEVDAQDDDASKSPFRRQLFGSGYGSVPAQTVELSSLTETSGAPYSALRNLNAASKSPFKAAAAQPTSTLSVSEQVRQLVQFEVQKQLDLRNVQHTKVEGFQPHRSLAGADPFSTRGNSVHQRSPASKRRKMEAQTIFSQKYDDDLTEMPELVPVRQSADGTIQYLDEEDVSQVMDR